MDNFAKDKILKKAELLRSKKAVIFDLDGTLAESKTNIDAKMSSLLCALMKIKHIAVIGGGKFEQFEKQLVNYLDCQEDFEKLLVLPTSGGVMYKYSNNRWIAVYENNFASGEKEKIFKAFEQTLAGVGYVNPKKIYGNTIEDRGGQITFSALGQEAPLEEKKKWNEKNDNLRFKLQKALKKKLPAFEIRLGGLTSIDITKKGIDKAYGIKQISKYLSLGISDLVYLGDALYRGGNDSAVLRTGIEAIKVSGVRETKAILKEALR